MKAVSYESNEKMAISSRAKPVSKAPTDALLRVGAIPIDFSKSDPVDRILAERKKRQEVQQSARPGEEKRKGVDCLIDAVGYQARDDKAPSRKKPTQVLENCLCVVNSTGHLAIIGVYLAPDPGAQDSYTKVLIRMNESKISAGSA